MKFRSTTIPKPAQGADFSKEKVQVVPDQSLSLQEILTRFTRGEPLEIGREVNFHDSPDDLEKIAHLDLVEREEYIESMKEIQKRYKEQEEARKKKAIDEEVKRLAEVELQKQKAAAAASGTV